MFYFCMAQNVRNALFFWHFQGVKSSRSQMFFKIGVLKNLCNFTGELLCWSLFLTKLQVSGAVLVSLFVSFEHISHLVLVFLLLTLSRQMPPGELQSIIFFSWQCCYGVYFLLHGWLFCIVKYYVKCNLTILITI